ncbi:MAG: prolipoprotein diacylglyceryl transferase [Candidatus Omnitrophica bacterium]|nr:prolipoprotein diacylglyceryl transferase [Candidatus Omnitrophota bacterium]
MFPVICKIGPIDFPAYLVTVAIIAGTGIAVLFVMACLGRIKREVITTVLFWVLFLAVAAMILILTPITIYSYGLMLALAVVICTSMLVSEAGRKGIKADNILDLVFWTVVGGIVGARIFYILLNYQVFIDHPYEMIMIQKGGLAWQGGLIFGGMTGASLVKRRKLFLPKVLDLCAPYLALGQSIGRIGCFLNGCCYGKEVAGGVYFPVHDAYLHPTQLYLTAGLLMIFIVLKRYQESSTIPGLVFASYLILTSVLRFGVEFYRADHDIIFFGLSVFQFVSVGILLFAFGFAYVMLIKHSNPEDSL